MQQVSNYRQKVANLFQKTMSQSQDLNVYVCHIIK